MVPDLPEEWKARYAAIHNIGICCVIFKLKRKVSPHFWVNITDASQRIPGIVEFSNLRPVDDNIVYVPYYMPITDPRFSMTDGELVDDSFRCLRMVNPELTRADLMDARVGRLRYAQPICEAGFASKIPAVQTPIEGLQVRTRVFTIRRTGEFRECTAGKKDGAQSDSCGDGGGDGGGRVRGFCGDACGRGAGGARSGSREWLTARAVSTACFAQS